MLHFIGRKEIYKMKKFERKFLVNSIPDISQIQPILYRRYFTYIGQDGQVRVQKRGEKYEIESVFGDYKKKIQISMNAFEELSKDCQKVIERETYCLDDNIKIKIYRGKYEGLRTADIEFESQEEFNSFRKPNWSGNEITTTPLGKDGQIILLSLEQIYAIIRNLQSINNELER